MKRMSDHETETPTAARKPVSTWNLANVLTMGRIALVPFFAWFLLADGGENTTYRIIAFVLFVVASITDRIDGQIARSRGLETEFGKLMDPIADKALMGMAFIGLSIIDVLPWWATIVVLARELAITALRTASGSEVTLPAGIVEPPPPSKGTLRITLIFRDGRSFLGPMPICPAPLFAP